MTVILVIKRRLSKMECPYCNATPDNRRALTVHLKEYHKFTHRVISRMMWPRSEKLKKPGWGVARKKPILIRFREVDSKGFLGQNCERIETREGIIVGWPDKDFIICGVDGELYPIKKDIFKKTYDVIHQIATSEDESQ